MFAAERKNIIKKYLIENKKAEVVKISELLNVSEVTVRRDFEKLENEGFLIRTHGGAIIQETEESFINPASENDSNHFENDEIAETAAALVSTGDIIMLTGGPINQLLAKKLSEKSGLTILTNNIFAAINASSSSTNKVICLGGEIDQDYDSLTGALTLKNIENYHVNRLFLEVDGISDQLDMSVSSQQKNDLITAAIKCTENSTLLSNYSIFGTKSFLKLGHISIIDSIVTNPLLDDEYKTAIYNENIILYTSINAFEGKV